MYVTGDELDPQHNLYQEDDVGGQVQRVPDIVDKIQEILWDRVGREEMGGENTPNNRKR